MVALAFLSLLFGILAGRYAAHSSTGVAANLREAMYKNIQRFSFSDIDKFSTAGLITRMTTDVSNIEGAIQMLLRISVRAPLNLISSFIMCFFINSKLCLIFLCAIIILTISLYLLLSRATKIFQQLFVKYDDLNGVIQENISAIRVVKSFVREDYEMSKMDKAAIALYSLNTKAEKLMALNHPIMNIVVYGCIIAISWFGAHFIVEGTMTTGELTSLFSYIMTIMMSLMMLSMIFVNLTMSAASAKRIAEVIDEEPDMSEPLNPVYEISDGSVTFEDVYFSYKKGGDYALEKINLKIEDGQTIGIIGGTGSGKSTLGNLISRLYDVSSGSVKIGGKDVREYDIKTLRNNVSVVLQKNTLFSGTVLENLRWGNENASLQECIEACKIANAHEFIENLKDGYDSMIEQGATNLSGGQRQRICLARALLKSPKVLILDDATSAVDTSTDEKIRESIAKIKKTVIIISHRILSIKGADKIVVMENGEICGFDTHEKLLENNPIYQEIYQMQTSGGEGDFDSNIS